MSLGRAHDRRGGRTGGVVRGRAGALALRSSPDGLRPTDAVPLSDSWRPVARPRRARPPADVVHAVPHGPDPAPVADPVVLALVAAFVAIEAFGLCSTFGQVVPA